MGGPGRTEVPGVEVVFILILSYAIYMAGVDPLGKYMDTRIGLDTARDTDRYSPGSRGRYVGTTITPTPPPTPSSIRKYVPTYLPTYLYIRRP